MRVFILTAGLVFLGLVPIAHAMPIVGRISVMPAIPFQAAEFEVSSGGMPIGFAGQAMTMIGESHWLSVWGDYRYMLTGTASIGLHAGLNQSWIKLGSFAPGTPVAPRLGPLRYLVGASFHHRFGNMSLGVNPTLVLVDLTTVNPLESLVIGPPLLEVAYRLTPSFEMGLRTSVTPLRASWVF
jgi:hypothetical protein